MATDFIAAHLAFEKIATESFWRLRLGGYNARVTRDYGDYPVIQIKLDPRYTRIRELDSRCNPVRCDPDGWYTVLHSYRSHARSYCCVGNQKVSYTKAKGFPFKELVSSAVELAQKTTEMVQEAIFAHDCLASSWGTIERLGQEFGSEEKCGVRLDPDPEAPYHVKCHVFVAGESATVENLIKILSTLPPNTHVSFLETFHLTEDQARPFIMAMRQFTNAAAKQQQKGEQQYGDQEAEGTGEAGQGGPERGSQGKAGQEAEGEAGPHRVEAGEEHEVHA